MIPRELLFGNPEKAAPKISPDASRMAFLAPDEGVLNVWVAEGVDAQAPSRAKPLTADRGRGIRAYFWADDGSLIYVQDKDGDENWHLYQVNLETKKTRDLTPFDGAQAQVLASDPKFPNEILAAVNARDKTCHDVYRINLTTGESTMVCENPGDVSGWIADDQYRIRACKVQREDGGSELRARTEETAPWKTLASWGPDEQGGAHGFTPDGNSLYVETSLGSDTTRLVTMSLDDASETALFSHDTVDVGPAQFHPTKYHLEAVGADVERLEWTLLDQTLEDDFATLRGVCDGDFSIASRDDEDRWWIVFYNMDTRPPCYYLYDRTTKKAEYLFSTRPKLEEYKMGKMRPVTIEARDGLKLRSFLSLPSNGDSQNLPLVLLVHGGPWARDHWGYHPEALWLADRGFAVLRINYRGSTGYGKKFLHAGDREWGAKMQDDLTDAVQWAVQEGIADAKRVAIYGGSYGGYAALAGAAFTPDVYACAVDIVGPSNLVTLIQSIPPYWQMLKRTFDLRVGDLEKEPDFLKSRSPLFAADKIEIPMLIAQGANDPRVKQAESEQIVEALKAKGKAVEYLLFPDEGHGFARPKNRLKFYEAAEKFLKKHLN